jgi:hypothetical protein
VTHLEAAKQRYINGDIDYLTLREQITAALELDTKEHEALVAAFVRMGEAFKPQPWAYSLAMALKQDIILERQVVDGSSHDQ